MSKTLRTMWVSMAGAGVLGVLLGHSDAYVLMLFGLIGAIADAM